MKRWILLSALVLGFTDLAWGVIYLPPAGEDTFPNTKWTFVLSPNSGPAQTLECGGPMVVRRQNPTSTTIQTEMLQLNLVCTGGVTVTLNMNASSTGLINDSGDSFFDVFFEIQGVSFPRLHNITPLRIGGSVGAAAPFGAAFFGFNELFVYDDFQLAWGGCRIPIIAVGPQTKPETAGEESPVFSCFYECKPYRFSPFYWREVTTLMLVNQSATARIRANLIILDGNERVIARTDTVLSPTDLDEVNVCETLFMGGVPTPQAGVVEVVLTDEFTGIPVGGGVYGWVKNVVGAFVRGNPEPFAGFANAVGKTECRLVGPNVVRPFEVLSLPGGAVVPARLIEGTFE